MIPMTPQGLRAQTSPAVGVQGAARSAPTGSGDDFARALRQETQDRVAARPREVARPEREADRSVRRTAGGSASRDDRSDVARSARADARRIDQRRDQASGGSVEGTGRAAASTAGQAALGTGDAATGSQGIAGQGVAGQGVAGQGIAGQGIAEPGATAADQAATAAFGYLAGSGSVSAEMLVRGAVVPQAAGVVGDTGDTEGGGGAEGGIDAADPGSGLGPAVTAISGAATDGAALRGAALLGEAVPGVGSFDGSAGALTGASLPAVAAPSAGSVAVAVQAAPAGEPADRAGRSAAAVTGLAITIPGATAAPAGPAATASVEPSVLASGTVGALGVGAGGGAGSAAGGQAGGSGTGASGTEGMTPVAAPASGAAPVGIFAQTLAGLGGVDRAAAPAAAGSASQVSLAEQIRGPVLALRTAAPGEHLLTLKVTPDNLGPVQVRAHIGADGIRIELVGATDAAREGLRTLLTDLRRDLAGTGMNATLSLGSDSSQGGRTGQGAPGDPGNLGGTGDGSAQGRPARPDAAEVRELQVSAPVPILPTTSGAHGVDVLT
ncbi:flagellar hook-length control protein FliK [Sanguibacter gelidistatuariae]|uniref:Flagellar hook-length control protein FliK n=1 Tax=Sanguibacter gelidistatuariae TaxID=1814289 RepID=A0A1G6PXG8_9MICO|nr:flagellar hook-length control protein FliK [Sanguibacter gelidistatuariae]SDC84748.1 flagellar hook-length control protein FliK [Sanguibacter gelidistatuariae]